MIRLIRPSRVVEFAKVAIELPLVMLFSAVMLFFYRLIDLILNKFGSEI
jgi:preprotein translocase subunit SecE